MSEVVSLKSAIVRHSLNIDDQHIPELAQYCESLWSWNQRLNLTRHTDVELFVARDLKDSLQLLPHLEHGATVLDVGSGGGVPGLVLAILRPDLTVSLAESIGRKASALRSIADESGATVTVYAERAEKHLREHSYDVLTIRAVAAFPQLLQWFHSALRDRRAGEAILIKGPRWPEELAEAQRQRLTGGLEIQLLTTWTTTGRDGSSVLIRVRAKD